MARPLNRVTAFLFVLVFCSTSVLPQAVNVAEHDKDYKDPEQFDRFYKRRKVIAAWQINQLKKGALVVKLRTNQMVIDALNKQGNGKLAEQKRLETAGINAMLVRAYMNNYNFSKVYFIYSHHADSLRKGARQGIFLDSNLQADPSARLDEKFYLMAETDRIYNSSIGFLPEDSASFVTEKGNPTGGDATVVVKNKYGHQLKRPFPFFSGHGIKLKPSESHVYVTINGNKIPYNISGIGGNEEDKKYTYNNEQLTLTIPKQFTTPVLSEVISEFNDELKAFYQRSREPDEHHKLFAEVRPYLY
jgi:hypothetical protein